MNSTARVAVVQAAPVVFDREGTLQKLEDLVADCARRGARLALFPEAFVSGYPRGLSFGAVIGKRTPEGREQYRLYWESSVDVPGPVVERLCATARDQQSDLALGHAERTFKLPNPFYYLP